VNDIIGLVELLRMSPPLDVFLLVFALWLLILALIASPKGI
jgi:hypothetical protein